jgi:hypothetical protein
VIPYEIKSANHPDVVKGKAEVGDAHYMLDVFMHFNVGPADGQVICPKKTYGKACPVCDVWNDLKSDAKTDKEKKAASSIRPQRKALMNIQLIEDGEPSDELLVWTAGHHRFMKEGILNEANACRAGGAPVIFADIDKGKVVEMRTSHSDLGEKDVTADKVNFIDRTEEIEDSVLEQAISFDECMVVLTAEQIDATLNGEEIAPEPTETVEEAPEEDTTEAEEPEVEEEKPAKAEKAPKKEKKAKKPKKKEKPADDEVCHYELTFGDDFDGYEDCDTCMAEHPECFKACGKRNEESGNAGE